MTDWDPKANDIFLDAVAIDDPSERNAFVTTQCAEDESLRSRVNSLLDAHHAAGRFLLPANVESTQFGENHDTAPAMQIPPPALPILQPGRRFADQFVIRRILGCGGMGIVVLADQDEPISRQVAIKINRPEVDVSRLRQRFEQERRVLALMEHPNIAKILQAGYVDLNTGAAVDVDRDSTNNERSIGHPYLVMDYVKGIPLNVYCDQQNVVLANRVRLIIAVCHAVQHAHSKGIIHRDLKPSNILIELIDGKPAPKIIDFGIAKPFESERLATRIHTDSHHLIGTLDYMSPEQSQSAVDIDTRTDVYSLGAVLYELLTGSVPICGRWSDQNDLVANLRRIQNTRPRQPSAQVAQSKDSELIAIQRGTSISKLTARLRGDLDWITLKSLEKDRSRRYQTAGQFADDLNRYLNHETVLARAPSWRYRMRKAYERNRIACWASATLLLLLISGTVGTSIGFFRAHRNAQRAEQNQHRVSSLLAESYLNNAETAARQGEFSVAMQYLNRMKDVPHSDLTGYHLLHLDVLYGLNEQSELKERVQAISTSMGDSPGTGGRVNLWQAEIALTEGDELKHLEQVQMAINKSLPTADLHYARSLVATETNDAIEQLELALAENPFHHRAAQMLPILYASLGRFEDARSQLRMGQLLYPHDTMLIGIESIVLTLEGQFGNSQTLLQQHQKHLSPEQLSEFQEYNRALNHLMNELNRALKMPVEAVQRMEFPTSGDVEQQFDQLVDSRALRIPWVLRNNLATMIEVVHQTMLGRPDYQSSLAQLTDISSRHPDGLLFYLRASKLAIEKDWPAARDAFAAAVECPSSVANIKPQALQGLIMSQCAIHLKKRLDEEIKGELRSLITRRLAIEPPSARELGQLSKAAVLADDLNLARSIIQKALEIEPHLVQLNVFLADIEFRIGNLQAAGRAAESALELAEQPKDAQFLHPGQLQRLIRKAKQIQQKCLEAVDADESSDAC